MSERWCGHNGARTLSRLAEKSWRCMSERCVTIMLRIEAMWIMLIQVYDPTDVKDDEKGWWTRFLEVTRWL